MKKCILIICPTCKAPMECTNQETEGFAVFVCQACEIELTVISPPMLDQS